MTQDDRMETITDPEQIRAVWEAGDMGDFPCCTTPAPVGAAVALDLDAIEARAGQVERLGPDFDALMVRKMAGEDAPALVAEVRRLRQDIDECWVPLYHDTKHERDQAEARAESAEAEVVTLRARLAAVEALADQWADRKRSDGMSGNAWIGLTLSGVAADLRAALATTGEGE